MSEPSSAQSRSDEFDLEELDQLYAMVSGPDGVTGSELAALIERFADAAIAPDALQAYREGRKPWKKLRAEIIAVARYVEAGIPSEVRVKFPLDDEPPDAWLIRPAQKDPTGIEVTAALGRAEVEIGQSLSEKSAVPGFIGLQDDAGSAAFKKARERGRITHSRAGIDQATDEGIRRCMERKSLSQFGGTLLITAPLHSSPNRSAEELRSVHAEMASSLPYDEVFVIDPTVAKPAIVRLK